MTFEYYHRVLLTTPGMSYGVLFVVLGVSVSIIILEIAAALGLARSIIAHTDTVTLYLEIWGMVGLLEWLFSTFLAVILGVLWPFTDPDYTAPAETYIVNVDRPMQWILFADTTTPSPIFVSTRSALIIHGAIILRCTNPDVSLAENAFQQASQLFATLNALTDSYYNTIRVVLFFSAFVINFVVLLLRFIVEAVERRRQVRRDIESTDVILSQSSEKTHDTLGYLAHGPTFGAAAASTSMMCSRDHPVCYHWNTLPSNPVLVHTAVVVVPVVVYHGEGERRAYHHHWLCLMPIVHPSVSRQHHVHVL